MALGVAIDADRFGHIETGLVAEELGLALAPEPWIETVVHFGAVASAITSPDLAALEKVLEDVATGVARPAVALSERGDRQGGTHSVEAIVGAAGWTIRGSTGPVWAAQSATLLLVSAKTPAGIGILIVDPTLSSVDISSYRTFDDGKASTITFSDCPAIPLNNMDIDQSEAVSHAECVTRIAYARHTVGVMEAALSLTVDYLKTRQQFGVPLRTFQNLTFRAADMYAAVELTRSMATWASMVLDEEPGRAHEASARSGALACRTARLIAEESVQLHGGIGITAEAPIAHHASRLLALQALMGGRPDNVDRLASTLEDSDRAELLRAPTELR